MENEGIITGEKEKKPQTKGINLRLKERRKELDYSVTEACIRLDIPKRKLYLIEHGYIPVSEKLKAKFIRKYKLPEDFFDDDFLGYPTPIEATFVPKDKPSKFSKFFTGWPFRIICFILMLGFLAMTVSGLKLTPRMYEDAGSFFSQNINSLDEYARKNGEKKLPIESTTGTFLADEFYSVGNGTYGGFNDVSVNFMDNKENMQYSFVYGTKDAYLYLIDVNAHCTFESRFCNGNQRVHCYMYDTALPLTSFAHVSADINKKENKITYNLVQGENVFGIKETLKEDSMEYYYYTSVFEQYCPEFFEAVNQMFDANKTNFGGVDYKLYFDDLGVGVNNITNYQNQCAELTVWGLVGSIFFLAICILTVIKLFFKGFIPKMENLVGDGVATSDGKFTGKPLYKDLKRNWPIFPFIPECVIRIVTLIIALMASLGIFYIFIAVKNFDVSGAASAISFKMEIASLSTLAMLLLFFTKLDIRQSAKNTFTINYVLFFAGLAYYFLQLIIQQTLGYSKGFVEGAIKDVLTLMPGNIIWGILAFNLLSSFLFSVPRFTKPSKKKYVLYRCLAIVPIAYMAISSLYSIGQKAWGWNLPFAVSSLLFSKALNLTLFSVLYCLVVYLYKHYTEKKYGPSAAVYQNGNKYLFIKNLFVAAIVLVLGVADIVISKIAPDNVVGAGGNYVMLFMIPIIIFYRPHMGKRNVTWDMFFNVSYFICMILGLLMVASSLSVYITSL